MKVNLMMKSFIALAVFGFMSQSAFAAYYSGCQTGCAMPKASCAPISCANACLEKIDGVENHWWSRKRDGYRIVFKGEKVDCCTGCAAPIVSKSAVLVPKKWFWEKDKYVQMPY